MPLTSPYPRSPRARCSRKGLTFEKAWKKMPLPSMNVHGRALESLAVPATSFMDGTWTDAVEAAMGSRARD